MTCSEVARQIRLYQLDLASKNNGYNKKAVEKMFTVLKTYSLDESTLQKLKQVEHLYAYSKGSNSKLTLQLTHMWSELDYAKRLDTLNTMQSEPLSLVLKIFTKELKESGTIWSDDRILKVIDTQIDSDGRSADWTIESISGKIATARGDSAFSGCMIKDPLGFPDLGIIIWKQANSELTRFNIYVTLLANTLRKYTTQELSLEALSIKNDKDASTTNFINSCAKLVNKAIESDRK
ncbi:MAG: hypothetical protein GQ570_05275 [Helicobacteraceae bacterium]|nr:hypothetical protein [Helicobacteraceae bacterium]